MYVFMYYDHLASNILIVPSEDSSAQTSPGHPLDQVSVSTGADPQGEDSVVPGTPLNQVNTLTAVANLSISDHKHLT